MRPRAARFKMRFSQKTDNPVGCLLASNELDVVLSSTCATRDRAQSARQRLDAWERARVLLLNCLPSPGSTRRLCRRCFCVDTTRIFQLFAVAWGVLTTPLVDVGSSAIVQLVGGGWIRLALRSAVLQLGAILNLENTRSPLRVRLPARHQLRACGSFVVSGRTGGERVFIKSVMRLGVLRYRSAETRYRSPDARLVGT